MIFDETAIEAAAKALAKQDGRFKWNVKLPSYVDMMRYKDEAQAALTAAEASLRERLLAKDGTMRLRADWHEHGQVTWWTGGTDTDKPRDFPVTIIRGA